MQTLKIDGKDFIVSPFGHLVIPQEKSELPQDHGLLTKYGLIPDDNGNTSISTDDKIDIDKLVQSYKDDCGVEAMLRLIKTGQADIKDFAWDGKTGAVDITGIPDYLGDLKKVAAVKSGEVASMAQRLNINIPKDATPDQLTQIIGSALTAIVDYANKNAKTSEVKANDKE